MRHVLNLTQRSATLFTFVGGYRVTLVGDDVRVEYLKDDESWAKSDFPPWRWIIQALKEIIESQTASS